MRSQLPNCTTWLFLCFCFCIYSFRSTLFGSRHPSLNAPTKPKEYGCGFGKVNQWFTVYNLALSRPMDGACKQLDKPICYIVNEVQHFSTPVASFGNPMFGSRRLFVCFSWFWTLMRLTSTITKNKTPSAKKNRMFETMKPPKGHLHWWEKKKLLSPQLFC